MKIQITWRRILAFVLGIVGLFALATIIFGNITPTVENGFFTFFASVKDWLGGNGTLIILIVSSIVGEGAIYKTRGR